MWKGRPHMLDDRGAALTVDGIPGPRTVAALVAAGHPGGVWALG